MQNAEGDGVDYENYGNNNKELNNQVDQLDSR